MSNRKKLEHVFVHGLGIAPDADFDGLTYQGIPEWDSVAHIQLVAELEAAFDIMLPTEDVLDMSSFQKASEILEKHGVALGA